MRMFLEEMSIWISELREDHGLVLSKVLPTRREQNVEEDWIPSLAENGAGTPVFSCPWLSGSQAFERSHGLSWIFTLQMQGCGALQLSQLLEPVPHSKSHWSSFSSLQTEGSLLGTRASCLSLAVWAKKVFMRDSLCYRAHIPCSRTGHVSSSLLP